MMRKVLVWVLAVLVGLAGIGTAFGETAGNKAELMETIQGFAENGAKEFYFTCTKDVLNIWKARSFRDSFLPSIGIRGSKSTLTSEGGSHRIEMNRLIYMPGVKILGYYKSGQRKELSEREQWALEEAQNIAGQATGTDLEKEIFIHDELCRLVSYGDDKEANNDDDCVIGALVDGKANCDGYADAFYLIGRLAGLNVRYFLGAGITEEGKEEDHMWNLIKLGRNWVMVDVTWDDKEGEASYKWFNRGAEGMKKDHEWDDDRVSEWVELCKQDFVELQPASAQ